MSARRSKQQPEPTRGTTPVELSDAHTTPRTRLITPEQLAERWQVRKELVLRRVREGKVPCVRVGRYVRFRLADIEEWEANGGEADE